MTVQTVINPIDNSEVTMIEGVIQRIIYKEAKPNQYGTTHNASLLIDGDYINFISMKVKEGREPQLQKVSGTAPNLKWEDINEGDHVKVVVKVGEYQGKPQYTSGTSKINIIAKGDGAAKQPAATRPTGTAGGSKASGKKVFGEIKDITDGVATVADESGDVKVTLGYKDKEVQVGGRLTAVINDKGEIVSGFKAYGAKVAKDDLGIKVGNSFTVALEAGFVTSADNIAEVLPDLVGEIDAVREQVAKDNPTMDAYALGARFGQSVVSAARLAKKGTGTAKILEQAVVIFNELNAVEAVIRAKGDSAKLEPTKTVATASEPTGEIPFNDGSQVDFDLDIPFAYLGLQYATHAIHALY